MADTPKPLPREQPREQPRVPLGEAIAWSEDDLDAFTSPEALAAASDEIAQAWRRDAAPADRGLIDADEAPAPERPASERPASDG